MPRSSEYTTDMADIICDRIAAGESLLSICEEEGMPSRPTVYKWMRENKLFVNKYVSARELQADLMFDQVLAVANETPGRTEHGVDAAEVANRRLKIDVLKWRAGKLRPKVYGDRQEIEHTGNLSIGVELAKRLSAGRKRSGLVEPQSPIIEASNADS